MRLLVKNHLGSVTPKENEFNILVFSKFLCHLKLSHHPFNPAYFRKVPFKSSHVARPVPSPMIIKNLKFIQFTIQSFLLRRRDIGFDKFVLTWFRNSYKAFCFQYIHPSIINFPLDHFLPLGNKPSGKGKKNLDEFPLAKDWYVCR